MKIVIEPEPTKSRTDAGWFITATFCDETLRLYAGDWKAIPGVVKAMQDKIREKLNEQ